MESRTITQIRTSTRVVLSQMSGIIFKARWDSTNRQIDTVVKKSALESCYCTSSSKTQVRNFLSLVSSQIWIRVVCFELKQLGVHSKPSIVSQTSHQQKKKKWYRCSKDAVLSLRYIRLPKPLFDQSIGTKTKIQKKR